MTVEAQQPPRHGDHLVHFYADESALADTVGAHLAAAVRAGAMAVVIATEEHRRAFEAELEAAGIDVVAARSGGTLVTLDAAATLARIMPGGRVDGDAFARVIGGVMREAAGQGRPVCAYGEMVALLWEAGDVPAAIEVEGLWNELQRELPFSLLCAYSAESTSGAEHANALEQVCRLHTSVVREVSREFEVSLDAPRDARRVVGAALREWGCDRALIEDAELVLGELTTNAVLHARSPFSVVARAFDSRVRLEVRDGSPAQPAPRDAGPAALSGRGMRLVAELSSSWGVEAAADGKAVWAELRR